MDRTGEGLGVERQVEDCRQLAVDRGFEVVETLTDNDISAYSGKKRPGYERLKDLLVSGEVDVVLAWHTDRLHRSLKDLEEYIALCSGESPIDTLTVRSGELDLSSATGRMTARVIGSVARHESEQKSERVRRARRQAAEAGKAHGPLGYGYDKEGNVIPEQAEIVREVASRLLDGETAYGIAKDLNDRGVPSPGAGRWVPSHAKAVAAGRKILAPEPVVALVRNLVDGVDVNAQEAAAMVRAARLRLEREGRIGLQELLTSGVPLPAPEVTNALNRIGVPSPLTAWRAANLGVMIQRGALCGWRDFQPGARGGGPMVARGDWTPILAKETTERLRQLMSAPERRPVPMRGKSPLIGVLECAVCGCRMYGVTDKRTDTLKYTCTQQPGLATRCGKNTVKAEPVDAMVLGALFAVLADVDFRENKRRLLAVNDDAAAEATKALTVLEAEESAWRRDLREGRVDRAMFMDAMDGIGARREKHLAVIGVPRPSVTRALKDVPKKRERLETWWAEAGLDRQRAVVRALIEKVVIRKSTHGGNRFDPARVEPPVWRA